MCEWGITKYLNKEVFYLQGVDPDYNIIYWVSSISASRKFRSMTEADLYASLHLDLSTWSSIVKIDTLRDDF